MLPTMNSRDQAWLEQKLQEVWERGFSDLVAANRITIRFGRAARTRLGSIRLSRDRSESRILMNRLFQLPDVPETVVEVTIAHELTHYLHGFSSPLEQKYSSPHAGGVVTRELKARGFADVLLFQKKWLKSDWPALIQKHAATGRRARGLGSRRSRSIMIRWTRRLRLVR